MAVHNFARLALEAAFRRQRFGPPGHGSRGDDSHCTTMNGARKRKRTSSSGGGREFPLWTVAGRLRGSAVRECNALIGVASWRGVACRGPGDAVASPCFAAAPRHATTVGQPPPGPPPAGRRARRARPAALVNIVIFLACALPYTRCLSSDIAIDLLPKYPAFRPSTPCF